jgi:hypothetical protein
MNALSGHLPFIPNVAWKPQLLSENVVEIQKRIDWPEFALGARIHRLVFAHVQINVQAVAHSRRVRMRLLALFVPVWRIRMIRIVVGQRIKEREDRCR